MSWAMFINCFLNKYGAATRKSRYNILPNFTKFHRILPPWKWCLPVELLNEPHIADGACIMTGQAMYRP